MYVCECCAQVACVFPVLSLRLTSFQLQFYVQFVHACICVFVCAMCVQCHVCIPDLFRVCSCTCCRCQCEPHADFQLRGSWSCLCECMHVFFPDCFSSQSLQCCRRMCGLAV